MLIDFPENCQYVKHATEHVESFYRSSIQISVLVLSVVELEFLLVW